MEARVLKTKDPSDFQNRKIHIESDGNGHILTAIGKIMDFGAMTALRKNAQTPEDLHDLSGGHVFANVGISALMTTKIQGRSFLVLAPPPQGGMVKLPSGYLDLWENDNPHTAMLREVAEELLPALDGKVVRGDWHQFPEPNFLPYGRVLRSSEFRFALDDGALFSLPGLLEGEIEFNGRTLEHRPLLYILSQTNSGQLVYPMHVTLPEAVQDRGSIHLAEDHPNMTSEGFRLDVKLVPYGMRLAEIGSNGLTGQLYRLKEGTLEEVSTDGVRLSEVFSIEPGNHGVVPVADIPFGEYMDLQARIRA